jgi:LysM repeat protein
MQANGLTTDKLRPGQVLYIPAPVPTATKAPPTAVPAGWVTYKVQSGDRIQRIAIWYGVTWADIIAANGLDGYGTVRVGQMLAIPNPPRKPVVYTVQEGDTLQGLSERFQISVDYIRIANYNFKGDTLAPPGSTARSVFAIYSAGFSCTLATERQHPFDIISLPPREGFHEATSSTTAGWFERRARLTLRPPDLRQRHAG